MSGPVAKPVARFIALFISITLALPPGVYAESSRSTLRQVGLESSEEGRRELEAALRGAAQKAQDGNPGGAVEEVIRLVQEAPAVPLPSQPAPDTGLSLRQGELATAAAGMEEGSVKRLVKGAVLTVVGFIAGAAGVATYNRLTAPEAQPPAQVAPEGPGAPESPAQVVPEKPVEPQAPEGRSIVTDYGIHNQMIYALEVDLASGAVVSLWQQEEQRESREPITWKLIGTKQVPPTGKAVLIRPNRGAYAPRVAEPIRFDRMRIVVADDEAGWRKIADRLGESPVDESKFRRVAFDSGLAEQVGLKVLEPVLRPLFRNLVGGGVGPGGVVHEYGLSEGVFYSLEFGALPQGTVVAILERDERQPTRWIVPLLKDDIVEVGENGRAVLLRTPAAGYPTSQVVGVRRRAGDVRIVMVKSREGWEEFKRRLSRSEDFGFGKRPVVDENEFIRLDQDTEWARQIDLQILAPLRPILFEDLAEAGLEAIQAVVDRLVEDPAVHQQLLANGWISLDQRKVQALGYPAIGGFIIADSAQVTDAAHTVIADNDLSHPVAEQTLPWLKAGRNASEVVGNAKQMNAGRGDLLVLEAGLEATAEQVKQLLIENGIEGAQAARAVLGDRVQVLALPVFAFQLFASQDGLPPVIVLGVMVRLQIESGDTYTLVVMV